VGGRVSNNILGMLRGCGRLVVLVVGFVVLVEVGCGNEFDEE